MISHELVLYCIVVAGAYLLFLSLLLNYIEKKLKLQQGIAEDLFESSSLGWSMLTFLMEALFYVVIPAIAYSFFYLIIPLSGVKAGVAAALFAFTLGAAPAMMGLSVRIKLPMPYMLFSLLSLLLKLGGSLALIGYIYAL